MSYNVNVRGKQMPGKIEIFKVRKYHLDLIKRLNFSGWDFTGFGAPAIDCKRPFGNSNVYKDMMDIMGWDYGEDSYDYISANPDVKARLDDIYSNELPQALQILTCCLGIKEGYYKKNHYTYYGWEYLGT